MTTFRGLTLSLVSLFVVGAGEAAAQQQAWTCDSGDPCLKANDNVSGGTAIWGNAGPGGSYGVFGTGSGYGVKGAVYTTTGTEVAGVYGYARAADTTGVLGESPGNHGVGVWGIGGPAGTGVLGQVPPGHAGIGVYGRGDTAIYGDSPLGWAGLFNGNVSAKAYFQSSDARLKKDVAEATYGLDQVLRLRPVTYKWNKAGDDQRQLGLIAQELREVVPELVHQDARSGLLSVNYSGLLPVMIKAVQEQQELIKRLEARVAELERERPHP